MEWTSAGDTAHPSSWMNMRRCTPIRNTTTNNQQPTTNPRTNINQPNKTKPHHTAALEQTPSLYASLPHIGTTSLVVSRVRRRVGFFGAWYLIHCVVSAGFYSTAPISYWIVKYSWSSWCGGGYIYLDMSENTCGVVIDATVPDHVHCVVATGFHP